MPDRFKQVWRRPRRTDEPPSDDGASHRTQRQPRLYIPERIHATTQLIGLGGDDIECLRATRFILLDHIAEIVDETARCLLARPETAQLFSDAAGVVDVRSIAARKYELTDWLTAAIGAPVSAETADGLAAMAHDYVRPAHPGTRRIKGHLMLLAVSQLSGEVLRTLEREAPGDAYIAASRDAWQRVFFVHLDLLLAVYSATEANPHWY